MVSYTRILLASLVIALCFSCVDAMASEVPSLENVPIHYQESAVEFESVLKGLEHAKANDGYLLVLVYGSEWSPRSMPMYELTWPNAKFRKHLGPDVAMFAADIPHLPTPEQREAHNQKLKGITLSYHTVPAFVLYDQDGQLLGRVEGKSLGRTFDTAFNSVRRMVRDARLRDLLLEFADEQTELNPALAAEALVRASRLSLAQIKDLDKRVKELDPDKKTGWADAATFRDYNHVYQQVANPPIAAHREGQTDEEKKQPIPAELAESIVSELRGRMNNLHLTQEQRMHILIAIGRTYQEAGMEEQAIAAYKQAMDLMPEHWAGRAHYRVATRHRK